MARKRTYDASNRRAAAEVTRARICASAEKLFLRDGYAKTSIAAVAREAGVAPATVYLAFENKAALLDATILRAVRDNEAELVDALLEPDPRDLIERIAAAHTLTMHRAAPIIAVGEAATFMDVDLLPMRERAHTSLRGAWRAVALRLWDAGLLRDGLELDDATDTLFVITNESGYLRFTEGGNRTPSDYTDWLATTLTRLLIDR